MKFSQEVVETARILAEFVRKSDPSRLVVAAVNNLNPKKDAYFGTLDIAGYNYGSGGDHLKESIFKTDHDRVPSRIMIQAESYPLEAFRSWMDVLDHPWLLGDFVWTAIDYIGEASIGWLDAVSDWYWTGYENNPMEVSVYSSCDEVELFLNNKSLGKKKTDRSTEFIAVWDVPYKPGVLKAIGYKGKKQVNSATLQTANAVAQIKLTADRTLIKSDGQDLSYITVELTDANGIRNPKAENLLSFEIEGPGTIIGVGNANPVSLESFQLPQRKAWQGRCLVVIKSAKQPGEIRLKVTSDGLPKGEIAINSETYQ